MDLLEEQAERRVVRLETVIRLHKKYHGYPASLSSYRRALAVARYQKRMLQLLPTKED